MHPPQFNAVVNVSCAGFQEEIQEDQEVTGKSRGLDTGTAPSLEKGLQQREAMLQAWARRRLIQPTC